MVTQQRNLFIVLSTFLLAVNFGSILTSTFTHMSYRDNVAVCIAREVDLPLDDVTQAVSNFDFDNFNEHRECSCVVKGCFDKYFEQNVYNSSTGKKALLHDCTCNGIADFYKKDNVVLNCDEITQLIIDRQYQQVGSAYNSSLANVNISTKIFDVPFLCATKLDKLLGLRDEGSDDPLRHALHHGSLHMNTGCSFFHMLPLAAMNVRIKFYAPYPEIIEGMFNYMEKYMKKQRQVWNREVEM
uniref:Uncharacterized protein n=1 Tax=Cacopsylla melanoneura TaxID=428564 RepID=A0A8D9BKH9_9HEMI